MTTTSRYLSNYSKIILCVFLISNVNHVSNECTKYPVVNSAVKSVKNKLMKFTLIKTKKRVSLSAQEEKCMQLNVFNEAGVESDAGKIAVAQVTLARKLSKKWGTHICEVVYSKAQFSWTLDKAKKWKMPSGKLWQASVDAVAKFKQGYRIKELGDSMFYHTDYIRKPFWAKTMKPIVKIDKHIFYGDA